jgi:hypothetical protein
VWTCKWSVGCSELSRGVVGSQQVPLVGWPVDPQCHNSGRFLCRLIVAVGEVARQPATVIWSSYTSGFLAGAARARRVAQFACTLLGPQSSPFAPCSAAMVFSDRFAASRSPRVSIQVLKAAYGRDRSSAIETRVVATWSFRAIEGAVGAFDESLHSRVGSSRSHVDTDRDQQSDRRDPMHDSELGDGIVQSFESRNWN